jgi:hypothetical protein
VELPEEVSKKISFITSVLCDDFWEQLEEDTKAFPDTADGTVLRVTCAQGAIALIIANYLCLFDPWDRESALKSVLECVKTLSSDIRNRKNMRDKL